jgi:Inward rectifier potassium channel transmembrane domain/Inward rectifier potassium channel C-terminal domain
MAAQPLYRAWLDGCSGSGGNGNRNSAPSSSTLDDPLTVRLLEEGREGDDVLASNHHSHDDHHLVDNNDPLFAFRQQENSNDSVRSPNIMKIDASGCRTKSRRKVTFFDDQENIANQKVLSRDESYGERDRKRDNHGHLLRQRKVPANDDHNNLHWGRLLDRDQSSLATQSCSIWNVQHLSKRKARFNCNTLDNSRDDNNTNTSPDPAHDDDTDCDQHHPTGKRCWFEFWNTWFYTLAYQRTVILVGILFISYTTIVVLFATMYYSISNFGKSMVNPNGSDRSAISHEVNSTHSFTFPSFLFCDMDIHEPMEALYFSLSTMASIGYGVSDYYFGNCIVPFALVLIQICTAICYDAIAIGLLFQRIRRSHKRSKTIVFTSYAVIQRIQNVPCLMIRIAELRHYPLLNATVRAYCIRHERYPMAKSDVSKNPTDMDFSTAASTDVEANTDASANIETIYYVTKPMQLQQLEILMNIPQVIVHKIDAQSPLCPPPIWYDHNGIMNQYNRVSEYVDTNAIRDSSAERMHDTQKIQEFVQDRNVEIIFVVEGTDELTGTCTQTKQSYTCTDLKWNSKFTSCIFPNQEIDRTNDSNGTAHHHNMTSIVPRYGFRRRRKTTGRTTPTCIVDFSRFHCIEPAPLNSDYCPYVN